MQRKIIDGKEYRIYRSEFELEAAKEAARQGENVLVSHACPLCGDRLLGTVGALKKYPSAGCGDLYHNSRPGLPY